MAFVGSPMVRPGYFQIAQLGDVYRKLAAEKPQGRWLFPVYCPYVCRPAAVCLTMVPRTPRRRRPRPMATLIAAAEHAYD